MKYLKLVVSSLFCTLLVLSFSAGVYAAPQPIVKKTEQSVKSQGVVNVATVNINNANAEAIAAVLTGVGVSKAEAIVAWRKANGKFTHIDQLLEVKGIGEKILAANKTRIKL